MTRKQVLLLIQKVAKPSGFYLADALEIFIGVAPDKVSSYLRVAVDLGYLLVVDGRMYPTRKLFRFK